MVTSPEWLLVGTVAAVGVLHTIVPDHWVPLTVIARQRGWSTIDTVRAAGLAGLGHVLSTLAIAAIVWVAGIAFAQHFGHLVDLASGLALVAFGGWIAASGWREMRQGEHRHGRHHHHHHGIHLDHHDAHAHDEHPHHARAPEDDAHSHPYHHDRHDDHARDEEATRDPLYLPLRGGVATAAPHLHRHRHGRGAPHLHWHDHMAGWAHALPADADAAVPDHDHRHKTDARTALLLILGSSPMVEGIPTFFAAGKYGPNLIGIMAAVFAASTIATYMALCAFSAAGLRRIEFGALERYGEVASGGLVALVGAAFLLWPMA